jgi:hypothetical protein
MTIFSIVSLKVKVHVRRWRVYASTEGSPRYTCSSNTCAVWALEGSAWSAPRAGRFTPGKDPVPIVQEAGWTLGQD